MEINNKQLTTDVVFQRHATGLMSTKSLPPSPSDGRGCGIPDAFSLPHRGGLGRGYQIDLPIDKLENCLTGAFRYQVSSKGGDFKDDECIKSVIHEVSGCLCRERLLAGARPATASADPQEMSKPLYGLMLSGNVGNGKTTLIKALQQVFVDLTGYGWLRPLTGMRLVSAKKVCEKKDDDDWFIGLCREELLCIDDLGAEPSEVMSYGNVRSPIVALLERRYDRRAFTAVITNLPPNKIAEKYGDRIADRCREMFERIPFKKSGIRFKTIPTYSNGRVKEAMSYENIDYEELYDNDDWLESTTYELFSSRFIFLVFRHPTISSGSFHYDYGPMLLEKVFFWTMPSKDIDIAEDYWKDIRTHVLHNQIGLEYFWKASDHKLFHVRPKGTKGCYKDAAVNPNGGKADKMCYWFNREYVTDIIEDNTK